VETGNREQQQQFQHLVNQWMIRVQTELSEIIQEHELIPALTSLEQLIQRPTFEDGQPLPLLTSSLSASHRDDRMTVKEAEKQRLERIHNQLNNELAELKHSVTAKRQQVNEHQMRIKEMNKFLKTSVDLVRASPITLSD